MARRHDPGDPTNQAEEKTPGLISRSTKIAIVPDALRTGPQRSKQVPPPGIASPCFSDHWDVPAVQMTIPRLVIPPDTIARNAICPDALMSGTGPDGMVVPSAKPNDSLPRIWYVPPPGA